MRAYAQASGHLAKTDRLEAQALARYGAAFEPPQPSQATDEPDAQARAELQDLLRRREQLVKPSAGTEPAGQGIVSQGGGVTAGLAG